MSSTNRRWASWGKSLSGSDSARQRGEEEVARRIRETVPEHEQTAMEKIAAMSQEERAKLLVQAQSMLESEEGMYAEEEAEYTGMRGRKAAKPREEERPRAMRHSRDVSTPVDDEDSYGWGAKPRRVRPTRQTADNLEVNYDEETGLGTMDAYSTKRGGMMTSGETARINGGRIFRASGMSRDGGWATSGELMHKPDGHQELHQVMQRMTKDGKREAVAIRVDDLGETLDDATQLVVNAMSKSGLNPEEAIQNRRMLQKIGRHIEINKLSSAEFANQYGKAEDKLGELLRLSSGTKHTQALLETDGETGQVRVRSGAVGAYGAEPQLLRALDQMSLARSSDLFSRKQARTLPAGVMWAATHTFSVTTPRKGVVWQVANTHDAPAAVKKALRALVPPEYIVEVSNARVPEGVPYMTGRVVSSTESGQVIPAKKTKNIMTAADPVQIRVEWDAVPHFRLSAEARRQMALDLHDLSREEHERASDAINGTLAHATHQMEHERRVQRFEDDMTSDSDGEMPVDYHDRRPGTKRLSGGRRDYNPERSKDRHYS